MDRTWVCRSSAMYGPHIYTPHSLLPMFHWPEDTMFVVEFSQEAWHYQQLLGYQMVTEKGTSLINFNHLPISIFHLAADKFL